MGAEGVRDVVVIGGGAAGLMAGIFAAAAGADTVVLEGTADGGRKILISGGGRCNVLPSELAPEWYFTASSPNTLKKILRSWPLTEQRAFFEEDLGIALALEGETGKLFPVSNRARDVRDGLVVKARSVGAKTWFGNRVESLEPVAGDVAASDAGTAEEGPRWLVRAPAVEVFARCVVIATGGLSVPKTGSDGHGLQLLERLGHTIHETYPALTPLLAEPAVHVALAGVSLRVKLTAPSPGGPIVTEGGFLFTHRGYSGPAVLDVSHVAVRAGDPVSQPILVSWSGKDEAEWREALAEPGGRLLGRLRHHLPVRLAEQLLDEVGIGGDRSISQLRREERRELLRLLSAYRLPWTGDEGYRKAEVTGGGIALGEVDPVTLESRVRPGLFLCGELLDAFGPIGGYNFAWAWATGRAAGRGAAARALRMANR